MKVCCEELHIRIKARHAVLKFTGGYTAVDIAQNTAPAVDFAQDHSATTQTLESEGE
jgi:hypothetical protein